MSWIGRCGNKAPRGEVCAPKAFGGAGGRVWNGRMRPGSGARLSDWTRQDARLVISPYFGSMSSRATILSEWRYAADRPLGDNGLR